MTGLRLTVSALCLSLAIATTAGAVTIGDATKKTTTTTTTAATTASTTAKEGSPKVIEITNTTAENATTTTTTTTTTTETTTTSTAAAPTSKATTTTALPVETSPSASLGSISFKTSNSKAIEVGKSTFLYITIKDMSGSTTTTFTCSNTSIATIEKINNTCVKVYGLKDGEVVITAAAGGKTAKYTLLVGNTASETTAHAAGGAVSEETTTTLPASMEMDLYSLKNDSELAKYIEQNKQNNAGTIILGVIGWAAIIALFGTVLSVIFKNRTPRMNLYPGSRRRFNTGVYHGNKKKHLLPDQYYRELRKY